MGQGDTALDREVEQHLEQILTLARQHFSALKVERHDVSENAAILKLRCEYHGRRVAVTEVIEPGGRWYSYYLLEGEYVLIGLDNYSDRPALRLKYGKDFTHHLHEPIPHLHTKNKERLELTEEKTFVDFVEMVVEFHGQRSTTAGMDGKD